MGTQYLDWSYTRLTDEADVAVWQDLALRCAKNQQRFHEEDRTAVEAYCTAMSVRAMCAASNDVLAERMYRQADREVVRWQRALGLRFGRCVDCRAEFVVLTVRGPVPHRCDECRSGRTETRPCKWCGWPLPRSSRRKFCDEVCQWSFYTGGPEDRTCPECGTVFETTVNNVKRFCCKECQFRNSERAWNRKRTRTREVPRGFIILDDGTRVYKREIADRDGWECNICDKPIDPELRHPDSGSLSIDHVVPVSESGPTMLDNLHATHFRCNIRKGSASLEAARLAVRCA